MFLLLKLIKYLIQRFNIPILMISYEIENILPQITTWISEQEKIYDASGEYKRHQIYSKAIKKYPEMRKRDLALAIEIAIQKL